VAAADHARAIDGSQQGRYDDRYMTSFELRKTTRQGHSNKVERLYLDFCPGGECVFQNDVEKRDLSSVLWVNPLVVEERNKSILRLLKELPGDLPDNRVSLYICPECGDIGCGAITAKISIENDRVTWEEFGYENNYQNEVLTEPFVALGPFVFDRGEYEQKLKSVISNRG
jgi:hypothetical protein